LYVPAVETDQWLLGRSNVKDSLVFGFSSWRLAPACIGSSGLPGVGIVKLALDRKLSFSRPLERTLRMSRVPGAGSSVAPTDAAATRNTADTSNRLFRLPFIRRCSSPGEI